MTLAKRHLLAIAVAVGLAGCAGSAPELADSAPPPKKKSAAAGASEAAPKPQAAPPAATAALNAAEVRALLAGNSVYASGSDLKFAALHEPDGRLKGKAWSAASTDTGQGAWTIEGDGRYCRKWDNGWAGGEWGCFKVYRQGNAVMMERVSGAGSNGQMTLVPGNAYGL